ncbi:DUF1292 domain-containing protein [Tepidibacillus fermentans]|uniref:Uncharacterized protein DUF1292 n=1 Tax=Tepidibacillus fermentans TaxID=1281767 RepID=A0A4R3KK89_9BACI|nr:DUF1292 domain-containing protein [Tepidibacillus fermentans]TCS83805.1 uncharacterized protein DUF1292 [Tepidibacillus fermentans]
MQKREIKEVHLLKEQLGSEVTLFDENEKEYLFQLLLELVFNGKHYAYFQSSESEEGEIEVLRVVKLDNGDFDLEFIEDDDEWEDVVELFDEWTMQNGE